MNLISERIIENVQLITGLDIEDLVIEGCCIPGYKYEIEYVDDYYGFEKVDDFKKWFTEELEDKNRVKIKNYIQNILNTNKIENIYVKDERSLMSYGTRNKAYHGVFNLKEYLKL